MALEPPDSGKINHGDTVVFGNFAQEGLQYKEDKRAIEYVKDFAEFFPLADGSKDQRTPVHGEIWLYSPTAIHPS